MLFPGCSTIIWCAPRLVIDTPRLVISAPRLVVGPPRCFPGCHQTSYVPKQNSSVPPGPPDGHCIGPVNHGIWPPWTFGPTTLRQSQMLTKTKIHFTDIYTIQLTNHLLCLHISDYRSSHYDRTGYDLLHLMGKWLSILPLNLSSGGQNHCGDETQQSQQSTLTMMRFWQQQLDITQKVYKITVTDQCDKSLLYTISSMTFTISSLSSTNCTPWAVTITQLFKRKQLHCMIKRYAIWRRSGLLLQSQPWCLRSSSQLIVILLPD